MQNLNPRVAILVPCYKRPEYTEKCLHALKDSQEYENVDFFVVNDEDPNMGLRNRIIDFFDQVRGKYEILAKMDNDCVVPKDWLKDILKVFKNSDADILSPNVMPSNAAFTYGKKVEGFPYMPSEIVGGLWVMKASLIDDMYFERHPTNGLTGAISILKQICTENDVKIGWVPDVVVEDIGHWSGEHPDHIKSKEHETYSKEVGREIAWIA